MTAPERGTAITGFELARRVGRYAPGTLVPYARALRAARTLDNVAHTLVAAGRSIRWHTSETDGRTHSSGSSS
jgi:hypothetical protein